MPWGSSVAPAFASWRSMPEGATLDTGERVAAGTVVWTAGMQASGLTGPVPRGARQIRPPAGRPIPAGPGHPSRFRRGGRGMAPHRRRPSLGDVLPACPPDGTVRRAQRGLRPGRPADAAVADRLVCHGARPRTVGALYTHGWDRRVVAVGSQAKQTKELINCVRIYPPLTGNPQEILDAAPADRPSAPRTVHLIRLSSCALFCRS